MSSTGITFVDVRNEAYEAIQKLKSGDLDVNVAKEIRGLLDTVIETGRVQVQFLNALPNDVKSKININEIKAMAGTLKDKYAELDVTLAEIKENQSVDLSKKP